MNHNYALIVGINDYTPEQEGGLHGLRAAIRDAQRFETWVRSPDGGNVQDEVQQGFITRKRCFVVTSTANPLMPVISTMNTEIVKMVINISKDGGAADRLYFYYAGHAFGLEKEQDDSALCMSDWSSLARGNALSSRDCLNKLMQTGYFREIVFLADCCRNTLVDLVPSPASLYANAFGPYANGGTKLFKGYATQYKDLSYEIEKGVVKEPRGVFTEVLLEGLDGAAAEAGVVDAASLKKYLEKNIPVVAQENGFKQVPDISHNFDINTPGVFRRINMGLVQCNIHFKPEWQGPVELVNGAGDTVQQFNLSNRDVTIQLAKGLYMLVDLPSGKDKPIHVNLLKNVIDVDF